MAAAEQKLILRTRGLSKCFGGNVAVESLDLEISRGGIHGLIGPNGSGKTTVLNLLSGHTARDRGQVNFLGHNLAALRPHEVARLGIARTFQNLRIFTRLTVFDNIRSAWAAKSGPMKPYDTEQVEAVLEKVGLASSKLRIAGELPLGAQRRLELGRAIARDPKLLMVDEPAGGMSPGETEFMGELLSEIATDGVTILLVEHKIPLVMQLCMRITVLNFGSKIAEGTPDQISGDAAVIDAYLGGEVARA